MFKRKTIREKMIMEKIRKEALDGLSIDRWTTIIGLFKVSIEITGEEFSFNNDKIKIYYEATSKVNMCHPLAWNAVISEFMDEIDYEGFYSVLYDFKNTFKKIVDDLKYIESNKTSGYILINEEKM